MTTTDPYLAATQMRVAVLKRASEIAGDMHQAARANLARVEADVMDAFTDDLSSIFTEYQERSTCPAATREVKDATVSAARLWRRLTAEREAAVRVTFTALGTAVGAWQTALDALPVRSAA